MTARQVIDQLNRLLTLDRNLTEKLVNTRYQVSADYQNSEFIWSMGEGAGLIGVLSGLVLDTEFYRIAANYDDDEKLIGFSLLELQHDGKTLSIYPSIYPVETHENHL